MLPLLLKHPSVSSEQRKLDSTNNIDLLYFQNQENKVN